MSSGTEKDRQFGRYEEEDETPRKIGRLQESRKKNEMPRRSERLRDREKKNDALRRTEQVQESKKSGEVSEEVEWLQERKKRRQPHRSESQNSKRRPGKGWLLLGLLELAAALAYLGILAGVLHPWTYQTGQEYTNEAIEAAQNFVEASLGQAAGTDGNAQLQGDDAAEGGAMTGAEVETEQGIVFAPHSVPSTAPSNLIAYTEVLDGETLYNNANGYHAREEITFGFGEEYTDIDGVLTFRGDNFRNSPAFGYAEMTDFTLNGVWSKDTSGLTYNGASWSGSGWTGQPLIVTWPEETRKAMNLYDWAKEKEDLTEVIYACMDGYVYFLELYTGQETRKPMYLGYTFKGSGALDPRGYPILYVGAGYDSNEGTARAFIVNLLDCSVMYTFGNQDSFSLRGNLSYFDSSALVDAETDTLIYPGENGILYLIKLNTAYDAAAGTLTVAPGPIVKWHYYGTRTSTGSYWVGMEDSAVIYEGYLFIADNGGNMMCLDLNTLQLVWVQDILDDSNSTPVLSVEDGKLYLYVSTSFHLGWRSSVSATIPVWKLDAETGEIVWQKDYECYTEDGVSGGVQSTIAVGKEGLSDYLYVTVARTGELYGGVLACLNRHTGEKVWEHRAYYAWSSPVCVYNSNGTGRVLYCTCDGNMYLLDGISGEVLSTLSLGNGAIEATPAVFKNYAVVGTRTCKIWGVELK